MTTKPKKKLFYGRLMNMAYDGDEPFVSVLDIRRFLKVKKNEKGFFELID